MNKASNLATRKGSSNYYYRESVPLDVQTIMARNGSASKNEIWKSLRTSSIQEAKIALVPVRAEQHRAWNDIRAQDVKKFVTPTDDELKTAAVTNGYDRAFEIQSKAFKTNVTAETLDAELHKRRDSLRRRALNPSERGDIERLAKSIVKNEKWLLDDEHLEQFRKYLNEAVLDSLNAIVEVFEGKPMPEPQSSLVRQVRERNLIKAPVGETLSELFERYQKAMTASGRKGKSSLQDAKIVIDQFGNFVGSKRAIRSITKAEARNFRDAFSSAPSRWNLRKEFRGLTLTQAGKKAEVEDWPLRSAKTVAKAISDISAFYTWAIKEGYADDNPTYGLKPSTNKDEGRLPSYQPEQLRSFFESPLFSGCDSRVGKEHLRGNKKVRDWRYWIPIISLFTGARVGEIAQLRCNDVKCIDGIWIFDIQKELDGNTPKSLKNKSSVRPVPIHSTLEKIGFFEYWKKKKSETSDLLFPEIALDYRGQMGGRPSRFIRSYLVRIKLKVKGLGVHSFRHTWTDECRRRGVYDALSASILGHSKGTMTSQYGELIEGNLEQRKDAIELLDFEGFDLHRSRG